MSIPSRRGFLASLVALPFALAAVPKIDLSGKLAEAYARFRSMRDSALSALELSNGSVGGYSQEAILRRYRAYRAMGLCGPGGDPDIRERRKRLVDEQIDKIILKAKGNS